MAHFAKIENNTVVNVIVAEQDFIDTMDGEWVQTSYNTKGNQHAHGKQPMRGNYAGIGDVYDRENDVFYEQKPFASWSLDTQTWTWLAPVPKPDDENLYSWDEENQTWIQE